MLRALDPSTPVILCPAMNTYMYQHAFTAQHLEKVQSELGYEVSGPQGAGTLACGDEGECSYYLLKVQYSETVNSSKDVTCTH